MRAIQPSLLMVHTLSNYTKYKDKDEQITLYLCYSLDDDT